MNIKRKLVNMWASIQAEPDCANEFIRELQDERAQLIKDMKWQEARMDSLTELVMALLPEPKGIGTVVCYRCSGGVIRKYATRIYVRGDDVSKERWMCVECLQQPKKPEPIIRVPGSSVVTGGL